MPRPTPAQITYGSATVVFSTLAMLLLSQTSSGFGIAVIAVAALALGLFVAVAFPMPRAGSRRSRVPRQRTALPTEPRLSEHSLHG
ncbi:hypothetical protein AB0C81_21910 [Streptomyces roseoverticillatus]|uniref:hypothetical protein n=1 Tax=Streptomyces roseoverticillatus TaxID=66429 RepID=UPI0033F83083